MGIHVVIIVAAVASAAAWILSLVTGDHSWVDRYWSIGPVISAWIIAVADIASGSPSPVVIVMAVLATAWGARLTFNFARRGGYSGGEDYRWPILRNSMRRWQFELFNLLFIVGVQNTLLVFIALPAWSAAKAGNAPFTGWESLLVVLFVAALVGETVADQEQWTFHQHKAAEHAASREVVPGFRHTGLWRFSRHPNYFFELAQWWLFYFFGVAAIGAAGDLPVFGGWINVSLIGPLLLTGIFIGSTRYTESMSAQKYPEYREYQRTTSAVVPFVPRKGGFDARVS